MNQTYHIFHPISRWCRFGSLPLLRPPRPCGARPTLRPWPRLHEDVSAAPAIDRWSAAQPGVARLGTFRILHLAALLTTQTYTNVHKRNITILHMQHAHSQSKVSFTSVMFSCSLSKSLSQSCTNFHEFLLRMFLGSSHGTSWHTVFPFECLWIRFKMFRHVWSKWMHV